MNWNQLICDKRLGMEEFHDDRHHTRSDFQRDYDRLIFSSPFRRLQNKTQVFPLPGSIFVHNRLTHSLEVSSVGRSMGNEIALRLRDKYASVSWTQKLDCLRDIVAAACLCHDLGNPPFGHSGEKTISTYFSEGNGQALKEQVGNREWADLINFEGNANSFRLLTHRFKGRRNGGMAMTYSSLASIVKYPYSSLHAGEKGKFGFFSSEEEIFRRVATQLGMPETDSGKFARHPLVYVTEAADDICYQIMDLEDAHKLKIIGLQEVVELLLGFFGSTDKERMQRMMNHLDDPNEKIAYLRSNAIGAMVVDCADVFSKNEETILAGEFRGTLVDNMNPRLKDAYAKCSATAWNKIYCAPEVVDIELAGNRIITYLLDTLMDAVMNPDKNYSRLLLNIIPGQYDTSASTLYERIQSVLDHISGMTDVYALDLFRKLNGHSLPAV
ncbi:MAG: deoxyguanosinetriphosphate triphosphohydrolase [Muribaculaceae bacterium]|uniref:deoxyguanosinetriphosphate triphosphohydrolase n=1 Tax=Sangeribacter muris TaxID=2880703 RepID=UPI000F45F882|nr:deoxyguanosinetriphosphate triphosphohydrolase [Sangeribacter muris]MBJ2193076.1 deoxyguanosinetriphosphate triphosphohydrolase [Muribaculaceae bacterium]ROS83341.1 deoxyguanosinetriphosphate triphosphohydrolase [Muribaculaceae bacterium Isolate-036 (Harlan)]ROT17865.1 deoxyguanosinetriphosphate triphosphohydrolase [Muribaculaceae bacterium Isolate-114 (HZI)]ROT18806.1 deoxyguanosinetriphosphate triphosphohydrolase [Muribaculaceae bacterium Isolate-113 (HZI)]RXE66159.1 deoxyguanosinetriphos